MPKIVSVYIGEQASSTNKDKNINLLKSIDQMSEAGFLDAIKKTLKFGKKEPEEPEVKEPEPDRARPDITVYDTSALNTLSGELMTPAPAETRIVIFLPHSWLKALYLIRGGGQKLIDELDDSEIVDIASAPPTYDTSSANSRIVELKRGFKYKSLVSPPSSIGMADRAILINAPKTLVAELRSAGTDVPAAREVLKKLMSHKLYVMTLNLTKAASPKLVKEIDSANSVDEVSKYFNPNIIENYPINSRLAVAMSEWSEMQSKLPEPAHKLTPDEKRELEVQKAEHEADLEARLRAADAKKAGPTNDENNEIINRITRSESPFKAADSLKGWAITKKINKQELLLKLDMLKNRYTLINIPSVIEKLEKIKF